MIAGVFRCFSAIPRMESSDSPHPTKNRQPPKASNTISFLIGFVDSFHYFFCFFRSFCIYLCLCIFFLTVTPTQSLSYYRVFSSSFSLLCSMLFLYALNRLTNIHGDKIRYATIEKRSTERKREGSMSALKIMTIHGQSVEWRSAIFSKLLFFFIIFIFFLPIRTYAHMFTTS